MKVFNFKQNNHEFKFQSIKSFYGRDKEIKTINRIFKNVKKGNTDRILISGYSGIGKSSLIDKLYYDNFKHNSYFIKGKFNQFDKNIPYKAVIQAFQDLINQLLNKNDKSIKIWKTRILQELGPNGQIIINVIPELELIIGNQPKLPELRPIENQNRFQLYFQKFINIFTKGNIPLIMFIDDLQWADIASLNLISTLISTIESKKFLFIGAYRNNEVTRNHPLKLIINEIKKKNIQFHNIYLRPLNISNVCSIISNYLNCEYNEIKELGEIVFNKTGGNPFFMNEFLRSLYQDKILKYNTDRSSTKNIKRNLWQWDIKKISDKKATDNVVDLFTGRINKFLVNTQELIKLAACIGSRFDLNTLSIIYGKSKNETFSDFAPLIKEDLLFYVGGNYNFVHDKIQEAVYSLINEQEKKEIHYKIGNKLLKNSNNGNLEKIIFYICDQLNNGKEIITNEKEKLTLIKLNLSAGKKAKESTAYESAQKYFETGIKLLNENSWENNYELTLSLYTEYSEINYLTRNFDQMEKSIKLVLNRAKSIIDKVKLYETKIHALIAQHKLIEAINYSRDVLKIHGIKIPKYLYKLHTIIELIKIKLLFRTKSIEKLKQIPEMTDQIKISNLRIMITTAIAVYYSIPNLVPIMTFKAINLSIKYGNTIYSSYCYCSYALILCGFFGKIKSGYKFGTFALDLLRKSKSKKQYTRVYLIFNTFIRYWKKHLESTLSPLIKGIKYGTETGDVEYSLVCYLNYNKHSFFAGKKLSFVKEKILNLPDIIKKFNQEEYCTTMAIYMRLISELTGKTIQNKGLFNKYSEKHLKVQKYFESNVQNNIADFYINKSMLAYLFYKYDEALENLKNAKKLINTCLGLYIVTIFNFYFSLTLAALYPSGNLLNKIKYLIIIKLNQKKMKKWAKHAPMNFLHKYYLIEAELQKIKSKNFKAVKLYNKAILSASKNKFINEEALANELTAKFYLSIEKKNQAKKYLVNAYKLYIKWGAYAKAKHIKKNNTGLL